MSRLYYQNKRIGAGILAGGIATGPLLAGLFVATLLTVIVVVPTVVLVTTQAPYNLLVFEEIIPITNTNPTIGGIGSCNVSLAGSYCNTPGCLFLVKVLRGNVTSNSVQTSTPTAWSANNTMVTFDQIILANGDVLTATFFDANSNQVLSIELVVIINMAFYDVLFLNSSAFVYNISGTISNLPKTVHNAVVTISQEVFILSDNSPALANANFVPIFTNSTALSLMTNGRFLVSSIGFMNLLTPFKVQAVELIQSCFTDGGNPIAWNTLDEDYEDEDYPFTVIEDNTVINTFEQASAYQNTKWNPEGTITFRTNLHNGCFYGLSLATSGGFPFGFPIANIPVTFAKKRVSKNNK